MKPSLRTPVTLLCCLGTLWVAHAAPQTTERAKSQRFGQFVLNNVDGDLVVAMLKDKGTTVTASGKKLSITSARYDIAAPKIVFYLKKAVPTNADATGGVRIAVRNPEDKNDTTLRADSAQYVGATPEKNAFIYAIGNVHTVTRTPDLAPDGPLVTDSNRTSIELLPDGGYNIRVTDIKGTFTPMEKPATPKRKP